MVRIVVIDDHDLVRSTLRRSFERHPGIEIVGEADGGEAGLEVVRVTAPEVVVVDVAMPGMDGAETIRRPLGERPFLRVIGYGGDASNEPVLLNAGAEAFVVKGTSVEELIGAVERVSRMERTGEPR